MKTVAVYNMKGGVGKTTAAVNLSYLAASAGHRTLLWDLDPQGASSFAFRVRPSGPRLTKRLLADGEGLAAAIKETDYHNLYLLPADFAYRKFDRFLHALNKPERLFGSLVETLGREFDIILLDCPAGFSLLTEAIFAASDVILAPTIPTTLSLRMVARLITWADHTKARVTLAPFFSMVDRGKTLHRRTCDWSAANAAMFLKTRIPYASVVEQLTVRRLPLAEFAPRDPINGAFASLWDEVEGLLDESRVTEASAGWPEMLRAVESLLASLEFLEREGPPDAMPGPRRGDVFFVHRFDTEQHDLEKSGWQLELVERNGSYAVAVSRLGDRPTERSRPPEVQIDSAWAVQMLADQMSPLAALEQRLGRPGPPALCELRRIVGGKLRRVESRPGQRTTEGASCSREPIAAVS